MANNSINLVDLDFEILKTSFRSYLQSQSIFKDYDFEGSNLNVLLDLLTYNTQKNAFFLNMNFAESFLDSAQLRDSILSHAKDLNYTPRSSRSAKAKVSVTFNATGESQPYIIQKGSSFSTLIKNESFIFSIPETVIISSANTTFQLETYLYEGIYLKDSFVFIAGTENQRFRISNRNVDTESLTVVVFEDNINVGDKYRLATSLLDLTSSSKVYFLQASENGYYEVLFGNGVIGRKPKTGSTIILDYRVSAEDKPNGARSFSINFDPTGLISELTTTPVILTSENAVGGSGPDSNESIKYFAPRHFQTQERAVVETDYEVLLKEEFPEINAVSVFGGELVDPPRFGKIFVSVDISDVNGLPDSKKTEYFNFLKRRCNLAIKPIFIEPEFMYIEISSLVRYNINISDLSTENIKTLVNNTVDVYNEENLDDFNVVLRYSQLVEDINNTESSIISNITNIKLYKKIQPLIQTHQNIVVDFNTILEDAYAPLPSKYSVNDKTVISSSSFRFNGQQATLADNGDGIIQIVKNDGKNFIKIIDIGTLDYVTGEININDLFIDSYEGDSLLIYAKPKDLDVKAPQNTILAIEPASILLSVEILNI